MRVDDLNEKLHHKVGLLGVRHQNIEEEAVKWRMKER